jgi:hypothetical protein
MLRRARLIGGLALGWGLLHGLHAGALMLVPAVLPALLPLCGGSAAGGQWLEMVGPALGALGSLASWGTQAALLLALPVLAAAWRRWRASAPDAAARSRR